MVQQLALPPQITVRKWLGYMVIIFNFALTCVRSSGHTAL